MRYLSEWSLSIGLLCLISIITGCARYPLHESANIGDISATRNYLNKGIDINAKDRHGMTPLMKAAHGGHIEIVRLLVEKGADVNAVERDGYSVLMVTESMPFPSNVEIVKLLLERGANVNAKANNGWTALMEAAKGFSYGRKDFIDRGLTDLAMVPVEFAKLLMESGADVNAKDMVGRTALMVAAAHGQPEIIRILIEKGADVNATDLAGNTALVYLITGYASSTNRLSKAKRMDFVNSHKGIPIEIANILIAAGADVNAKGKNGVTPLMMAADSGLTELAKLLIEKGADVNAKTNQGLTAFSCATVKGYSELAELLKQAGGEPTQSPIFNLTERLRFHGFSILPPQGDNWSVADSDTEGILFKRCSGKELHTIHASARIAEHGEIAFKDGGEFLQYWKGKLEEEMKKDFSGDRFKPVKVKVSSDRYEGRECVRYDFTIEDHGSALAPGSALILTGYGFCFLHPDNARFVINIDYSQRFPKGETPLPLEAEVEPFFRSLAFTAITSPDRDRDIAD